MGTATKEAPVTGTDIVALVEATPVLVLTDKQKFSEFYEAIKQECDAHIPDLTTDRGRKEIASLAYKVARTKTAIDEAGKKLNEEARARINAVDESRREIRKQLDDLKDEVRRPLTEWEEAEEKRVAAAAQEMTSIREMQRVDIDDTAESVQDRLSALEAMAIDPELHAAGAELAERSLAAAIETLKNAHARLVREEEERAELERLRAADIERQRQEEERRAAEEVVRRRREYAEAIMESIRECGRFRIGGKVYPYVIIIRELEEKIPPEIDDSFGDLEEPARKLLAETLQSVKDAQHAEHVRLEKEAAERAAQEAREEEHRKATAKAAERERQHEEALAAERKAREKAEADAAAERERIAEQEAARKAEEERIAAEARAREADKANRNRVKTAAKQAIMSCGADEETAKKIVLAIVAGEVPHVSIAF